jgi:class 3 adenylate cyclase/tetratricopeptide (TPR) repeat protein
MSESRQLAVIMFTDIVGYTALMDGNEREALELLDKNRSIHQEMIDRFHGRLLKEMGDGIMASFPTTYDAILCSSAIMSLSSQEKYQLRIGLHEGEVIVKQEDIFGEGVNIASRVEALAKPGQILVTESVYRNIRNKPGITTEFLGEKQLKNVSETWRVHGVLVEEQTLDDALTAGSPEKMKPERSGERKVIPARLVRWIIIGFIGAGVGAAIWMSLSSSNKVEGFTNEEVRLLREKIVTVLPFEGPASGWLEEFGEMAPYWISTSLKEVTDGKMVDAGNAESYEDIPAELVEGTGLEIAIMGRYFKMDRATSDLELFVELIDLRTAEKRPLGRFVGNSTNPEHVLEEATQKIMSIWALSGRKRFSVNPPRYDAFREYEAAYETWGSDYDQSIDHLMKAYELDTTFYEALLRICVAYGNTGRHAEQDSLLRFIQERNPELDPWTSMRLELIAASAQSDNQRQARIAFQIADYDPKDFMSLYNAAYSASLINRPDLCISYCDLLLLVYPHPECHQGTIFFHSVLFRSYFVLGRYHEIVEVLKSLDCVPGGLQNRSYPLKACVRMGRLELIDTLLAMYAAAPGGMNEQDKDRLLEVVVKDLYMAGKSELMGPYLDRLAGSTIGLEHWGQFFKGNYAPPIEKWRGIVEGDSTNYRAWGHLAFMLAHSGDTSQVRVMLNKLQNMPDIPYLKFSRTYYLGVLHALLGEKEKATDLLKRSHAEGYGFGWATFEDDFRLTGLFDYPPFQEFVEPDLEGE